LAALLAASYNMSLKAAEAHLLKDHFIGQSSFDKFSVGVLRALCDKMGLAGEVACSGKRGTPIKKDYISAILAYVSAASKGLRFVG
jgi:hypothetical protein